MMSCLLNLRVHPRRRFGIANEPICRFELVLRVCLVVNVGGDTLQRVPATAHPDEQSSSGNAPDRKKRNDGDRAKGRKEIDQFKGDRNQESNAQGRRSIAENAVLPYSPPYRL